ncbi:MAG: HAD-IIA family hydrolase [Thermomicrobiales bacterium]|nr:HAD-IIA family hydrolase [Thermomicrobiales bacterium]
MTALRGYLIDVDGVLRNGSQVIPGAADTVAWLRDQGIPFRLLTNNTVSSRASLAEKLRSLGFPVTEGETFTAASATAAYVARRFPEAPCYLLSTGDSSVDFRAAGISLVGPDGAPEAGVVVIGGAEHELTYARLNHAYRLLLGGAKLVAMHRNVAWRTDDGMTLDSGPFIEAIARAAGVRVTTIGKPAQAFFRQAIRDIAVPAARLGMIGDDARNDIAPAQRLGLTGILVRSGKPVSAADAAAAHVTLASIADLPAWDRAR